MTGRWPIPESWQWVQARDVAEIIGGGTPSTRDPENFAEVGIPWLTPADLSGYEGTYIKRGKRDISEKGLSGSGARLLPAGTVLFTSRAPIGYCVIAENEISTNQGFKSLVLRDDMSPEFVRFYLKGSKKYAESLASGSTFKELSGQRTGDLAIPVPPLNEQRRIVAKIEELTARSRRARVALEAVPPLLEQLRQSVLAAAFSGRLTVDWRKENPDVEPASVLLERIRAERRRRWEENELAKLRAKGKEPKDDQWKAKYKEPEPVDPTGLPDLPEGWCWANVQQVGLIESGQTPKGVDSFSKPDGEVPYFRVGDMNTEGNELNLLKAEINLSVSSTRKLGLHVWPKGTVVFPKRGGAISTNKKRLLGQPSAYDLNTMGVIVAGSAQNWFWFWFQSVDLGELDTGSSVPQINHGDIAPLPLPIPPEEEQKEIIGCAARLTEGNGVGLGVNERLIELSLLDQSILAKAFRGELVPQDPNDEPASVLLDRIRAQRAATETDKMKKSSRTLRLRSQDENRKDAKTAKNPITDDDPLQTVLHFLQTNPGPHSKSDILTNTNLDPTTWPTLAPQLNNHPQIHRTGEKRGTRYEWTKGDDE